MILILASQTAAGQSPSRTRRQAVRQQKSPFDVVERSVKDTLTQAQLDSLKAVNDSLAVVDSLFRTDSLAMLEKSSIKLPAFTSAGDSIIEVFSDGRRLVYYYGGATVEYENMQLSADYMEYDMNTGIVYARGTKDTLTGEWTGRPVMKQGKDEYEMDELRYNFNTKQAFVTNMNTKDEEGSIQGKNVKMEPDQSINISKGQYTVCDAEDPHYLLRLSLAKVMTEPSQKTVFGPAWVEVEGVPLPVVLPFGFIPEKPERATGFMMPSFGEENARGFYMRDAGMYLVLGDYFDMSVTGDLYTMGSWALDVNSRYKVNYKFSGTMGVTYSKDVTGEKGAPDYNESGNFGIKWSHSQDAKSRPGTNFSASVNFSSPSNNKYNARSLNEALQNQASSSISYSKNWNGKFNLSVNALHSQNSRDSSYSFSLPNITFSMTTIYPFKRQHRIGKERAYEKISFGYNTSLQNNISFKASEFNQPGFLDKFKTGMNHNFSIGLPNFTIAKYLNVTPGLSYGQSWFFRRSSFDYNPETNRVEQTMGKMFNGFGITQTTSASVSMSTRIYGMFNFGKYSKVQAIRHVISPSLSMSYVPDLKKPFNGWRTLTYTDNAGNVQEYSYNLYAGQLGSIPSSAQSATASLQIGNNLEAKVRDYADTTGTGVKKVKLIDQLSLNTSYNFLADSCRMNNIGVTMSTNLFEKVNISANANFSPYAIDAQGRQSRYYCIQQNGLLHPIRLTNAGASLSYSINGEGKVLGDDGSKTAPKSNSKDAANCYQRNYYHPITGEYIPGGWVYYMNPNVPWSVNFSYSLSYSRTYSFANEKLSVNNKVMQTLSANGNLKLTPKMSLNMTTGFDLTAMKITTSSLSATYDLHCFNIAVSWIPTGQWQSYSFCISANASTLADLLRFKKSTSFWDN